MEIDISPTYVEMVKESFLNINAVCVAEDHRFVTSLLNRRLTFNGKCTNNCSTRRR